MDERIDLFADDHARRRLVKELGIEHIPKLRENFTRSGKVLDGQIDKNLAVQGWSLFVEIAVKSDHNTGNSPGHRQFVCICTWKIGFEEMIQIPNPPGAFE